MPPDPSESERNQRIAQIIDQARQLLAQTKPVSVAKAVARYPELQPELEQQLNKLLQIERAKQQAAAESKDDNGKSADEWATVDRSAEKGMAAEPSNGPLHGDQETLPLPIAPVPMPPRRIRYFGDYELQEELGRGGMGVVFKARQVSLNRAVAVKMILSASLASEEAVRRFYAEAEAAAKLEHPNIVPIYEIGDHNGDHYFSMAYVEGQSLHGRIGEQLVPSRQAAEYLKKLAGAMAHAHGHGVLHRDLKPANVLLDEHDEPRITDFGLAKQIGGESDLTATGQVLGTPNYMPPEQALGDHENIGPESDVYSLGAILYHLVTGRPPFQGESTASTLIMVTSQEPVEPHQLNPALDRDLETIALKCLQKSRESRYRTASELEADLGRYLRGEPIKARPLGRPARLWRWCKRNRAVASLAAAVLVVLALGTIGTSVMAIQASDEADLASQQRRRAQREERRADQEAKQAAQSQLHAEAAASEESLQRELAEQQLRIAQRTAHNHLLGRAHAAGTVDPARALALLNDPKICPIEMRGFEWNLLYGGVGNAGCLWEASVEGITCLDFSPATNHLVTGTRSGQVQLWEGLTGASAFEFPKQSSAINGVRFSKSGKWVAAAGDDGRLSVWSVDDGSVLLAHDFATRTIMYVTFTSEDRVVVSHRKVLPPNGAYADSDFDMRYCVLEVVQGTELEEGGLRLVRESEIVAASERPAVQFNIPFPLNRNHTAYWAANPTTSPAQSASAPLPGKALSAVIHSNLGAEIRVFEAGTRVLRMRAPCSNREGNRLCFDPSGEFLYHGDHDGRIALRRIKTAEQVQVLRAHKGPVLEMDVNSDGSMLGSCGADGKLKCWSQGASVIQPVAEFNEVANALYPLIASSPAAPAFFWTADTEAIHGANSSGSKPVEAFGLSEATTRRISIERVHFRWTSDNGAERLQQPMERGVVNFASLSADGQLLAVGQHAAREFTVVDLDSWKRRVVRCGGQEDSVSALAFLGDGRQLLAGVSLNHNAATPGIVVFGGSEFKRESSNPIPLDACWNWNSIAVSRDGALFASTGNGGYVYIWDIEHQTELHKLHGHEKMAGKRAVQTLAFDPSGKLLFSGGADETIRVWDVRTGECLRVLRMHLAPVSSIAVSPDGRTIASGDDSGEVRLWDGEIFLETVAFQAHTKPIAHLIFDSTGRFLASRAMMKDAGEVKIWGRHVDPLSTNP